MSFVHSFLPPATKLGQGYVFTGVCDSVHRGACMVAGGGVGGMHGCQGHAWLLGVHGCQGACIVAGGMCGSWGTCMVAGGGMHGCRGGHAWLLGCMHGCWGWYVVARGMLGCWGVCIVAVGCAWLLGVCVTRGPCMVKGGMHGEGGHTW